MSNEMTISSREIAKVCKKRHDNVLYDIRQLNQTYIKNGLPEIQVTERQCKQNGMYYPEALLTRIQCVDLVAGYSPDIRIWVTRAWEDLQKSYTQEAKPEISKPDNETETVMNNQMMTFTQPNQDAQEVLISSREIAKLCEKTHGHILRDIEKLNKDYVGLGLSQIGFSKYVSELNGIGYKEALLTRLQCLDLVSGYRPELRIRIIRRLAELEEQIRQPAHAIPQTYAEALQLAADMAKENERQAALLAEAAPKVQALERISRADGDCCITDAAKLLKVRPRELFDWLSANAWIYKRNGRGAWIGYQDKVQAGYLRHSEYCYNNGSDEFLRVQVNVTPKGIAKLAEELLGDEAYLIEE